MLCVGCLRGQVRGCRTRRQRRGAFFGNLNPDSFFPMNMSTSPDLSRRNFVRLSAASLGAAALTSAAAPRVFGATAGSDRIRVGVVGCGGRGPAAADGSRSVIGFVMNALAFACLLRRFWRTIPESLSESNGNYPDINRLLSSRTTRRKIGQDQLRQIF